MVAEVEEEVATLQGGTSIAEIATEPNTRATGEPTDDVAVAAEGLKVVTTEDPEVVVIIEPEEGKS